MTHPLVVIGAGGFGREILDVVHALAEAGARPNLLGVIDDAPSDENLELLAKRGVPYLGDVDYWLRPEHDDQHYVIGVGDPHARRRLAERIQHRGRAADTLIHPRAAIGTQSGFGEGTVICAGALISTNVRCGAHVHLNPGSIVGHDSRLHSFVSVNPGAIISGTVNIETAVLVGAGATVLQDISVGADAVIGAAACVVRDVPPNSTVMGVPAK